MSGASIRLDQFEPELVQLAWVDGRRCAGQRVTSARRLREGDHLTDVLAAADDRDDPIEAHRDAPVRRGAVAKRVEQEAEPGLRLVGADPDQLEHPLLDVGAVVSDRAAADLIAVEHQVVAA